MSKFRLAKILLLLFNQMTYPNRQEPNEKKIFLSAKLQKDSSSSTQNILFLMNLIFVEVMLPPITAVTLYS